MLENTFLHIPRIGRATEEKIWSRDIFTWDDYLKALKPPLKGKMHHLATEQLCLSQEKLIRGEIQFFYERLRSSEQWRLFGQYHEQAAYLDIETTGLGYYGDHITTMALYTQGQVRYYVYGQNLEDFGRDIREDCLLITYNGKGFDLPFIERDLGISLKNPHIDLRYVLGSLGYRGGLKGCEKQMGICRGDLEGVDGYFAVLLWEEYMRRGNQRALETLLAYNIEDTVNLELLMFKAYNEKIRGTPFGEQSLELKEGQASVPFEPDPAIIEALRKRYAHYSA